MITNVLNAYLGDSSVSRLYQGDQLIYDSGHPDILLKWIANGPDDASANPNVYFDTGFTPQLSTKVEFKYETPTLANGRLFGCGNANTANTMYNFNIKASGNTPDGTANNSLKFFYRGGNIAAPFAPEVNTPYTVTLYGTYSGNSASGLNMVVNGTTYSRSMTASTNITGASSAYIFRWNGYSGGIEIPSGVKFYYLKIWEENNLVKFFIPVLHWTNNQYVPCFYDKVNDSYIYNLGTDTPTYKITDDYVLDYIQNAPDSSTVRCDVQYNTGVDTSVNLLWDAAFRAPTDWPDGSYTTLFGVQAGNNYYPPEVGIRYSYQALQHKAENFNIREGVRYDSTNNSYGHIYINYSGYNNGDKVEQSTYFTSDNKFTVYMNDSSSGLSSSQTPANRFPVAVPEGQIRLFGSFNSSNSSIENTYGGARLYYLNFRYVNSVPAKTYIPVLHNNQAAFLDLNSNTYIYNLGTDTPSYSF